MAPDRAAHLRAQALQLLVVSLGQLTAALALSARALDSVAQRALVDAKITGDLGDRLLGLSDDPDPPSRKSRSYLILFSDLAILIVDASTLRGEPHTANAAVLDEGCRVLIDDDTRFENVAVIGVDEHAGGTAAVGRSTSPSSST